MGLDSKQLAVLGTIVFLYKCVTILQAPNSSLLRNLNGIARMKFPSTLPGNWQMSNSMDGI